MSQVRVRYLCPHCGNRLSRWAIFFSKGELKCGNCGKAVALESWSEKMRLLPYILGATLLMELLRDNLPALVRTLIILGPPILFMPMVLRIRKGRAPSH